MSRERSPRARAGVGEGASACAGPVAVAIADADPVADSVPVAVAIAVADARLAPLPTHVPGAHHVVIATARSTVAALGARVTTGRGREAYHAAVIAGVRSVASQGRGRVTHGIEAGASRVVDTLHAVAVRIANGRARVHALRVARAAGLARPA